jgi:hypothetical protein
MSAQPKMQVLPNGTKSWWLNGKLHRTDGPAFEGADGSKEWWLNGELHRSDGPAVEMANGRKEWWLNGNRHRTDGPAIEWTDGSKEWRLNGEVICWRDLYRQANDPEIELRILSYALTIP